MTEEKPPLPPFTRETAAQKVQAAEDAWNTCDPERVALAYTPESVWRNRDEFVSGRAEIVGSAPYIASPTQGCRRAAMCTRIWWVRPVSSWISSSAAA